jgi:hypothetical protein
MSIRIPAWEHADLLDFFEGRFQWIGNENKTLFLRVIDETQQMAVKIDPPKSSGPLRLYTVTAIPLEWSTENCDEYLQRILSHYTGYAMRKRFEQLLGEECGLGTKAYAAAIALSGIVAEPDISFETPSEQLPLEARTEQVWQLGKEPPFVTWLLARGTGGGGYMKISWRAEQLHVEISAADPEHGGFTHPLRGILRPRVGSARASAERLLGIPGETSAIWEEGLPLQQELEDASDTEHEEDASSDSPAERLSDDSGTAGESHDGSGEPEVRLPDEPIPFADV